MQVMILIRKNMAPRQAILRKKSLKETNRQMKATY